MISPRRARLVERRALKDRATGGSEQGRERVSTAAEPQPCSGKGHTAYRTDVPAVRRGRMGGRGYI